MGILGEPEKLGSWPRPGVPGCVTALQALWNHPVSLGPGQMLFEVDPNRLPGTPGHV